MCTELPGALLEPEGHLSTFILTLYCGQQPHPVDHVLEVRRPRWTARPATPALRRQTHAVQPRLSSAQL